MPTGLPDACTLGGSSVLIVEDEVIIALTLESEVAGAGGNVIGPAFDLSSAIRLAEQEIDVAVLDINLRGEKIFPAARRLRERGVPLVFASANCDDLDAMNGEFDDCPRLEKPIASGALIGVICGILRARATKPD